MDCLKVKNGIGFGVEMLLVRIVRGGKGKGGGVKGVEIVQCGPLGVVQVVKEMRRGKGRS